VEANGDMILSVLKKVQEAANGSKSIKVLLL
jgi:hypothetical protein